MSYERMVGLQVTDDAMYSRYREAMRPMLERHGGGFRYDFRVSEVLKSESDQPMNRVFIIHFPDQAARDAFFSDPEYLAVRDKFFKPAVAATTVLAEYSRP